MTITDAVLTATLGDTITDAVAEIAEALRYPVLILALVALGFVFYEIGRLAIEAYRRSQTNKARFDNLARTAVQHAQGGDSAGAQAILRSYAYGDHLQRAAVGTLFAPTELDSQRAVIDYDLYASHRLDRVRLLVRSGPALGLMGTLIPLAPALAALGEGNEQVLADELQTAFAITVLGVAVGLIAFTVALVRERYYTRDLADLEFLRELRQGDALVQGDGAGASAPTTPMSAAPTGSTPGSSPAGAGGGTPPESKQSKASAAAVPATPPVTSGSAPDAQRQSQPTTQGLTTSPSELRSPAATPQAAVPLQQDHQHQSISSLGIPDTQKKKKFAIRRKAKPATPDVTAVFPPPPPPPPPAAQGTDKGPSIPDAPGGGNGPTH